MSAGGADDGFGFGLRLGKKFFVGAVLVVLFSAIGTSSALLLEVKDTKDAFQKASKPIPKVRDFLADVEPGEPQTILLLGSDRRYGDIAKKLKARSDTIIVARLDPDKHATAMMSLPRDLIVDVPGFGKHKINEAYELGGPNLTILTVDDLLGLDIQHVISVHFGGFRRAINRLGCVYIDVDRRYFNDNSGPEPNYAAIDLKPGYQKLCGEKALDYVRFRHADSDFVRAARQQQFLRQVKDQFGIRRFVDDRKELLRIFGRYTESDISQRNTAEILGLVKLALQTTKTPIVEVPFPATDCPDRSCVEISPEALTQTVERFIDVRGKDPLLEPDKPDDTPRRVKAPKGLAPGLIFDVKGGEDHVLAMDVRLSGSGLPVLYPKVRLARRNAGYATSGSPRSYEIADRAGKRHRAYRIVLYAGDVGEYYGVQGTTWKNAPILDDETDKVRMRGRTYRRYFDGHKIRMLAFETPKAVYWVSNTLSLRLTNRQMMEIARSLQPI
ncbi:MAG: polyisoprenyl-teichoic acid--peptidoglycan teichoic acid transferase [Solirubrobacteraceae bacterium]|nr:polyisoprenyl-teichoic acid--peptidoglycan teichoic acid transferase [Solirubrobacteraceae bacterium]